MTVLSLIPSSVRKVQSSPFLAFPSAQTNMAATKSHSPVIHPYEALAVSEPLPAHGPGTHYKMPWPEIHRAWLSHAGKAFIHRSAHALFIRQKKIFGRGGEGPDKSSFFYKSKGPSSSPTSTMQHPCGHRQTHDGEVHDEGAALDFAPGSI